MILAAYMMFCVKRDASTSTMNFGTFFVCKFGVLGLLSTLTSSEIIIVLHFT